MGFNYGDLMKQAKAMQRQLDKIREEIKGMVFEASSGGGAVKVKVDGEQVVREVKIEKEVIDSDDIEMLEDLVLVAINDAINKSKEEYKAKMSSITGGINMPGMF
ncbi:MAG TPA: YbaB/EbfC family nucleoid-associated protein [Actinobacteria bacterium]|nr:YbaB/EbfC family nucleoid-associated protein [Actinomycetota bacterium]